MIRPRTLALAPMVTIASVAAVLVGAAMLIPVEPVHTYTQHVEAPEPASSLTVADVPLFFEGEYRWDGDTESQTAALDVLQVSEAGGLIVATGRGTYTTNYRSVDFTFRIEADPTTGSFTMWESDPSVAEGFVTAGRHLATFDDSLDGITARWVGDNGENGTLTLRATSASARPTSRDETAQPKFPPSALLLDKGVALDFVFRGSGARGCVRSASDTVTVHYSASNKEGTFDDSWMRGRPATFPLNAVIEGWRIAVPQMCVGDFARVWIPADAAYGDSHPHAAGDLVFDIELLDIKN